MNKRDTYNHGKQIGMDIAHENIYDVGNVNAETRDSVISEMCRIESEHFRQFSPFEFFANDINNSHDPDGIWDAYDKGVYRGVTIVVNEAIKEMAHA